MRGPSFAKFALGLPAWLLFLFLAGLIMRNSTGYVHSLNQMPFLEEKAPISEQWAWRASLLVHVAAGMICFAASILQFFRGVLRRWPALHRRLGKIYAASVLWFLCPSGFYLAVWAKGGWLGQSGFFALGALTAFTTWQGVVTIRAGQTARHARWMIRSFAMITTAITFRIYYFAFSYTPWDDLTNYLLALWLSVAGNTLAAEGLARLIPLPAQPNEPTPHTMNRNPSSSARPRWASLSLLLPAEPPASVPEKPLVISPADAARRTEAQAAIQREVVQAIQLPSPAERFSRTRPILSSNSFTIALTDTAPEGILANPAQLPFVVSRTWRGGQAPAETFLSGYYDANSKTVQLYSSAAGKYLPASEHPYLKTRTPKKP